MDRRTFMKLMGGAGLGMMSLAAGVGRAIETTPQVQADTFRFDGDWVQVPEWTGDSFKPMHRVRDGVLLPVPEPSRRHQLVIVGGGLTGLTAAYFLREEDLLVLEREETLGGTAKSGQYQGSPYSLGPAYLVDTEEPYGPLYDELGLKLSPVKEPRDMAFMNAQWHSLDRGPMEFAFTKLKRYLGEWLGREDFPGIPIQKASSQALALDRVSFYDFLKNDYPADLLRCIDAYCFSALGGGIREVSAYAGVNFYSEIAGQIIAFPGGNSAVAQRLVERVQQAGPARLETGVSVYRIQQVGDEVHTSFFQNQNPDLCETVASKAVVLAVPYFFAHRIVAELPEESRSVMRRMRYGSYLVANCCFDRPVFQGGYDHWTPNNPVFTDFIAANHVSGEPAVSTSSVLTVYAPFRNPVGGRMSLIQGDRHAFAQSVGASLQEVTSFAPGNLKEVALTRYGHQMVSSRVGLIHALHKMPKEYGRIVLAHSDGQGMAAIESAVAEGIYAANAVRPLLKANLLQVPALAWTHSY